LIPNPEITGGKLVAGGYSSAPSPLRADATFYSKFKDGEVNSDDEGSRFTLGSFNRVVVAPPAAQGTDNGGNETWNGERGTRR
jgi:hypothetical protein